MAYRSRGVIKELLRGVFEGIGISRYSRPGKYQLDSILQAYLPAKGVFLEVGALDGLYASNTYYLEKLCGWSGVLVEPVPHFFRECVKCRRKSRVFNCALVPDDYTEADIRMVFAGDKSAVRSATSEHELELEPEPEHFEQSEGRGDRHEFDASARTLTSVLDEAGAPDIDFFSLDVEGYEIQVLNGLDMSRFRPEWILVECLTPESKEEMLSYLAARNYEFVAQVTPRDLLWRAARSGSVGEAKRTYHSVRTPPAP